MLTRQQARAELVKHLTNGRKARHSLVVAHVLRRLAEDMGEDASLWEIVGLCHDLDYMATKGKRHLHGILAAQWLENDLPREALEAIRAHDHRTGVQANSIISKALRLTDALAIADEDAGREAIMQIGDCDAWHRLALRFEHRPYLLPIITELTGRLNLPLSSLPGLFENAPPQ